jgi:phosphoglycerate dehydrogenase-like enzyme
MSDIIPKENVYFSDRADDYQLAQHCPVWFGIPSLVAPLLKHCDTTGSIPEWVQSMWAGIEPLVMEGMPTSYRLTNMRGIFNDAIAEYVLGHILSHALHIRQHIQQTQTRQWNNHLSPRRIGGGTTTVAILGVGEIGSTVARVCQQMGMKVYGYSRTSEGCPYVDQYFHTSLECMAPDVDYWVNVMPNTPQTVNILHKGVFESMKQGAVIINVGRGSAIVEEDLYQALESGKVDTAILDVFRNEPLPLDSKLWSHPKVIITSHTAAPTDPSDAARIFVDNYQRFCANMPLRFQVDFQRGY